MRVGVTENLIDPQIKLDGKWEVALCDISLTDPSLQIETGGKTTTTSAFKKFRKSDLPIMTSITPGHHNSCMILKIQLGEDRLLRMKPDGGINNAETDRVKEAWRRYNYGNNTQYGTQSNDFDKWMNDLKCEQHQSTRPMWIIVGKSDMIKLWGNDPNKEITIQELLTKLNSGIQANSAAVRNYIRMLFKNNEEAQAKLLESPYFKLPEFKYKNGYLSLKTPYYVSRVFLSDDLVKLFKFDVVGEDYLTLKDIFKRTRFQVPNFLRGLYYWRVGEYEGVQYEFNTEKYFINTPCRKIVSYLPGETTTATTTVVADTVLFTAKVDGGVLGETRIGSKFESILRLVWIKKGEIYKQFQHRIYIPLRYDTLNNFNIRVINTSNNQQVVNGFAILHFRKRYECHE